MHRFRLIPQSRFAAYAAAVSMACGLLIARPSFAVEDFWGEAASGTWSAGGSWLDGSVPNTPTHEATFVLPGTYTVSFSGDPQPIGQLTLEAAANITFASSSRPPNPIEPRTLGISDDNGGGRLEMSNGTSLTLGATSGGSNFPFHLAADSEIQVFGGSTLTARFGSHLTATHVSLGLAGRVGSGNLALISRAVATSLTANIGNDARTGSAIVSGVDSRWTMAGSLEMGLAPSDATSAGQGTLTISGGAAVQNGQARISNGNGGSTATVTVTGDNSLWKSTALQVGAGGTVQIQPGGTVRVDGETSLNSPTSFLRLQGGTLDTGSLFGNTQFDWTGGTLHVGTFHGSLLQNAGTLAPGHSAGVANVLGGYSLGTNATLEIEIGGASQGVEYDILNSTNGLLLLGQLDLELTGGFTPTPAQTFIIINSQGSPIAGALKNAANGARITTVDGAGSFQIHYGPGSVFDTRLVVLNNFQSALAGDFDIDGDVDGNDFLVWQRGASPNQIGTADLAAWKTHFGATAVTSSGAAVPEPRAKVMAASLALWALLLGRPPSSAKAAS